MGTYLLEGTEVLVRLEQGVLLWYCSALGFQVELDFAAARDEVLGGDLFQAAFPDSAFPSCLAGELEALRFQYVLFGRDAATGAVTNTSMEGFIPGAVWQRAA